MGMWCKARQNKSTNNLVETSWVNYDWNNTEIGGAQGAGGQACREGQARLCC